MFYIIKKIGILSLFILICSCNGGSDSKTEKCKFGAPVAIFSKDLEKITAHQFSVKGQKGIETVSFENGTKLELIQTGCNELRQNFSFSLDKELEGDEAFWIDQAEQQFRYLALLSNKYASYALWANIFDQGAHLIKLGETFEPEGNIFITLDHISSPDQNLLIITLEQK